MSAVSKRRSMLLSLLVLVSLLITACAPAATPVPPQPTTAPQPTTPPQPTEAPTEAPPTATVPPPTPTSAPDYLADILKRGTLVISTDPAYPPQSELVKDAKRADNTKCTAEQHTASELKGFDIAVAVEIAKRLGVEACFVTPDWTLITAGSWAGRWDISVGSMTITPERMQVLYFSQPYYTTPAAFFVQQDNTTFTKPEDLSGKKVGACTGCTYDRYLAGTLDIPGEKINFIVKNVQFKGYDTDTTALEDLVVGRLDAVLTAQPTGAAYIASGKPVKQLGDPVFFEYLAAAVDKEADKDPMSFLAKVTEIIQGMHKDGTLKALSQQYYQTDLTSAAATFDITSLNQGK